MLGTYKLGILAEYIVVIMLVCKGYKILKLRYRNPAGEIDIIARKKLVICFIEVKARVKLDPNYELVSPKQIHRIRRAAALFIAQNSRYHQHDLRFDLVVLSTNNLPTHIQNAW